MKLLENFDNYFDIYSILLFDLTLMLKIMTSMFRFATQKYLPTHKVSWERKSDQFWYLSRLYVSYSR